MCRLLVLGLLLGLPAGLGAQSSGIGDGAVNSIGMELIRIDPGSFTMGETNTVPVEMRTDIEYLEAGDWDERPVHRVEITRAFDFPVIEVTVEQYRAFDPDFRGSETYAPYASGVSWYEARDFCAWLAEKEGEPYRLPTEAEWEYAARAGTESLFWSGAAPPAPGAANPWGIRNVHSGVAEWVADWHGMYPRGSQVDPVGPEAGMARVVRGGGLDREIAYYARSANRASAAPDFPPKAAREAQESLAVEAGAAVEERPDKDTPEGFRERHAYQDFVRDVLGNQGNHPIGFRCVRGTAPETDPTPVTDPFFQQGVRQSVEDVEAGPAPDRPYFRKRRLLPVPPENTPVDQLQAIRTTGLHPAILRHQHSPALEVAANGDVIAIYYTSVDEVTPDVALLATRLRRGADQWDTPSLFLDFADVDDHAPMLWLDGDSLRFFWGWNKLDSGFPFQWTSSGDHGATWTEVRFPVFTNEVGPHSAQPITSGFRDAGGSIRIGSDAVGPESVLWTSADDGATWIDPEGRTGGRHTAFVEIEDGCILGMGGKSSDIDGFMPKSISCDGGRTWKVTKTPFPSYGSNQRPTAIRLASGRLFFAGDLQRRDGLQPEGVVEHGALVALSDDEGETWTMKPLPGAEWHESSQRREEMGGETIGYAVARQAPDRTIHLITSMNPQALHFAMNEAWILTEDDGRGGDPPIAPPMGEVGDLREHVERHPDGSPRVTGTAGVLESGRYVLHGVETWRYPHGSRRWETTYAAGRKTGMETYWREDGSIAWTREHRDDGTAVWTRYWPNGQRRTESTWGDMRALGTATEWSASGEVVRTVTFEDGVPVD